MKKVLGIMIGMFLLIVCPFGGLWTMLISFFMGNGVAQSYLYPLYGGIILLAGIIVGAAVIIYNEIKELKDGLEKFHKKGEIGTEDT